MFKKLKSMLGGDKLPETLTADGEKKVLEGGDVKQRLALAGRGDARPEVLYYLADDSEGSVRKAIAANPSTPYQANELLTDDKDDDVRVELARKIGRMMPDLGEGEKAALRESAIKVLEKLASDSLPKVRASLAQAIKSSDNVPKAVVDKLARDLEDIVSVPVLEFSPLLNERDLREIIAAGASSKALAAIAGREEVAEDVSADISATLDIPALSTLLTNENAQIREDTLDEIIEHAEGVQSLHKPLALRPTLSIRAMKRIAGFVASALVHTMVEKSEIPPAEADKLLEDVRDRIADEKVEDLEADKLRETAQDLLNRGALDDAALVEMVENNQRDLCVQSLALLSDVPDKVVRAVIHSKSGRAVTALAWRAGLKMRTAYSLQTKLALVPNAQLLPGKNGDDYPMSGDELEWHLSYFIDEEG